VAIEILEGLADSEQGREREADRLSAMTLRAYFIARLGSDQNGGLLNLEELVRWFLGGTGLSLELAREKAARWKELEVHEIRSLRDIKNRLAVFSELQKRGLLADYPELQHWLSLRASLP